MKKIYLNTLTPEEIIARLKNGEVAKNDECEYKIIDGILYLENKYCSMINANIRDDNYNNLYFEEEEKFEITETGLYLTKNRLKAFVSRIDDDKVCGIIEGGFTKSNWDKTGTYMNNKITDFNLISKWKE